MNKILCFLVVMFSSATIANAACTKASIVGTWKIKTTGSTMPGGSSGEGCEFIVQKDGKLKNSSCERGEYDGGLITDKAHYPVTGNLSVDSSCNVIGSVAIEKTMFPIQEFAVSGNLNTKGNDVFIGTLKNNSSDPTYMDKNFYAVKTK